MPSAALMNILAALFGTGLVFVILWETFETIILPRRVTRKIRLTRLFYRLTWLPWSSIAISMKEGKRRENFLSFFGPLSLLLLLIVWAVGLVLAFALLQFSIGSNLYGHNISPGFASDLYMSGTTFFTLGLGDVVPTNRWARFLTVVEGGMGFGFLALVIGYLPTIYQSLSRREVNITLLDARAGSPPTAAALLERYSHPHGPEALRELLRDWEWWSADLLETHLSYPVLAYFRSQHDNQSWLGALTTILDICALAIVGIEGNCKTQAEMTFAMARHAVVDLSQIFSTAPNAPKEDRLTGEQLALLRKMLADAGWQLRSGAQADMHLAELRALYEPYVHALAQFLCMKVPEWRAAEPRKENWRTSAWDKKVSVRTAARVRPANEAEHF